MFITFYVYKSKTSAKLQQKMKSPFDARFRARQLFYAVLTIMLLVVKFVQGIHSFLDIGIEIGNVLLQEDKIGLTTTYTFYLQRSDSSSALATNAYLQITFPVQYVSMITHTTGTQIDCSSADLSSPTMYCTYTGNVLKVLNAFATTPGIKRFNLDVNGVKNPFPARIYEPFEITLFNSDGSIVQSGTLPAQVTTSQGLSTCSIIKYTSNIVSTRGSILISYQSQYITNPTTQYKMLISLPTSYTLETTSTINPQITGYSTLGSIGKYTFQINYTTLINISLLMPPSTKGVANFIQIDAFIKDNGNVDSCVIGIDTVLPNTIGVTLQPSTVEVQKQANYSFTILPSSPIYPTDSLVVEFPSQYSLNLVPTTITFTLGIFGTKNIVKSGTTITVSSLVTSLFQPKSIKFDILKVTNPFDSHSFDIKLRTVTNDNAIRDESTYSLSIDPGKLTTNSFTCTNLQIGYKTACKLNFTLSNSIKGDSQIKITFPSSSWMTAYSGSNTQCAIQTSSTQLKSQFQCRFQGQSLILSKFTLLANTVSLAPFTVLVSIQQSSVDVDHRIQLPWEVGTFLFSINTYSVDGYAIDSGSFSLKSQIRQLLQSDNNSIDFQKQETLTSSKIFLTYTLPYDKSVTYALRIYLPLQLINDVSTISTSYGAIVSYDVPSAFLTIQLPSTVSLSKNITISGFKTYQSQKSVTYTAELVYQNVVYFYFSSTKAIPNPRQFSTLTVDSFSSQIVYSRNDVTLIISELGNGDNLIVSTTDYTGFLSTNQSSCSTGVISCNSDGSITVKTKNNYDPALKLTKFTFSLLNPSFTSSVIFTLQSYDSTSNYKKQTGTFSLSITQTLPLSNILYTSSNPYYKQQTTLVVSLLLKVPQTNKIIATLPSSYSYVGSKCVRGCMNPSFDTVSNVFIGYVTGNDISIELTLINPNDFSEMLTFLTKDNLDRNKEQGQLKIVQKCASSCRSCSSSNASSCQSCYNFTLNKFLSGSSCVQQCPQGQYQSIQSYLYYCKSCPSSCQTCTSDTICQKCKPTYNFFNNICLLNCPSKFYSFTDSVTGAKSCKPCYTTCEECSISSTTCSKCVAGYLLYQNSCRTDCPSDWFIVSGECVQCTTNCAICQDYTAMCQVCSNGFYLYEGNCYAVCPVAGYAKNVSSGKCELCPSRCQLCGQFVTECSQCTSSYYLLNSQCITSCSQVQGYYSNTVNHTCQLCQSPCKTCTGSATYCQSCIAGQYLYNHECYSSCPSGTYQSTTVISSTSTILSCTQCQWPCLTCSSLTICSSCGSPFVLSSSSCVNSCGSGQFVNSNNQCEVCPLKCKTCNATGCLSCASSEEYLSGQNCMLSCSPLYKNQQSRVCQACQTPCQTCSNNSTLCSSCIAQYSLLPQTSACYKSCPVLYFSQNSICKLCQSRNPNCKECSLTQESSSFSCSLCIDKAFFYGYICIDKCPNSSYQSNGVCLSENCSMIESCQICSDTKCIACRSLYTLTSSNTCEFRVVSAVASLPVPFPFLILTIFTLISSFILKLYFGKMYIPIYLYSFCGLFEAGCIGLWTGLAIKTSSVNLQETVVNVYFATLLIVIMYVGFNVVGFVYGLCRLKGDKKYEGWQRQDNRLGAIVIKIVSLLMSFRFMLVKFSRLGHKQLFSATLQSKEPFQYLNVLSISSIFLISIPSIVLSAYLTYTQTQLNYLFFTCLQIAIMSVIMIILSIMSVLIPEESLLFRKQEYKQGHASELMQGQSIEEIMCGVVEEEYHERHSMASQQKQVIARNDYTSDLSRGESEIMTQMMTKALNQSNKALLQDEQSQLSSINNQNDLPNPIQSLQNPRPAQTPLIIQQRTRITTMLQQTLKAKQQILDKLMRQEQRDIITQVNEQFEKDHAVEKQQSNRLNFGIIKKQLVRKFQDYEQHDDQISEIGSEIKSEEQNSEQMTSSKLLNPHRSHKRLEKLPSHQLLSLQQENQFVRKQEQQIHKQEQQLIAKLNEQSINHIKQLLRQLQLKQQQQRLLKQKLTNLDQQLSQEQYIKLRERIQRQNMQTQDKLSRLNQVYNKRKQQRLKRKSKRIGGSDQINQFDNYVLDKEDINSHALKAKENQLFMYEPKEIDTEEISPKKIFVQPTKKKNKSIPKNIELENKSGIKKSSIPKPKSKEKSKQKTSKKQRQKPNQQQQSKQAKKQNPNPAKRSNQQKIKQKPQLSAKSQQPIQKPSSAASTRIHNAKFNNLESISQEGRTKTEATNMYEGIDTENKPTQQQTEQQVTVKTQTEPIQQEPQLYLQEQSDKQEWQPQEKPNIKTSPLQFNQPLQQDQPNRLNNVNLQQQKEENIIFQHQNEHLPTQSNHMKISYHQGNVESLESEVQHWPIDFQLEQKIKQIQQKANRYLTNQKSNPKLNNYASQTLHFNDGNQSSQKMFHLSGPKSKYTQIHHQKTEILSKDNSLFYGPRQSQMDVNLQRGQLLVFEDNEEILDNLESSSQSESMKILQEQHRVTLMIDDTSKIPKRRVNRSVINLSPGKY